MNFNKTKYFILLLTLTTVFLLINNRQRALNSIPISGDIKLVLTQDSIDTQAYNVGNDWVYGIEINDKYGLNENKQIKIDTNINNELKIRFMAEEKDTSSDYGTYVKTVKVSDLKINGSTKYDIPIHVREDNGRYTGNTANITFHVSIQRVLNIHEIFEKQVVSLFVLIIILLLPILLILYVSKKSSSGKGEKVNNTKKNIDTENLTVLLLQNISENIKKIVNNDYRIKDLDLTNSDRNYVFHELFIINIYVVNIVLSGDKYKGVKDGIIKDLKFHLIKFVSQSASLTGQEKIDFLTYINNRIKEYSSISEEHSEATYLQVLGRTMLSNLKNEATWDSSSIYIMVLEYSNLISVFANLLGNYEIIN